MVHAQALPGTPAQKFSMSEIVEKACQEASLYQQCGVDAVLVENMHDMPYLLTDRVGPEITAAMTTICYSVRQVFTRGPVGVQILAGANKQSLAVAQAAGLQFLRAEGFVFSHIADEGLMNSCAGELLRYRRHIGADNVQVLTDIKKKHSSHAITEDVSLVETAKAAEFFQSDGVIVTGSTTGQETNPQQVTDVQSQVSIPVLVGSGVTQENVHKFQQAAGLIIGSHFKRDGHWENDIDKNRVLNFMSRVKELSR
ncbi:uncharacterized protein F13E9.13, mitochondrial-like [Liolophura sinensis]|uniref:uncharacterized protein F13E9.13, mitochondrial-like n=1 Tax=Liolophura sinensis TaxID=3198878 RepID=UPI0031582B53